MSKTNTRGHTDKRELTFAEIRALMELGKTECVIEPKESAAPSPEEEREFASIEELWRERKERISDE